MFNITDFSRVNVESVKLDIVIKPNFKKSKLSADDIAKLPLIDNLIKVDFVARKRVA